MSPAKKPNLRREKISGLVHRILARLFEIAEIRKRNFIFDQVSRSLIVFSFFLMACAHPVQCVRARTVSQNGELCSKPARGHHLSSVQKRPVATRSQERRTRRSAFRCQVNER